MPLLLETAVAPTENVRDGSGLITVRGTGGFGVTPAGEPFYTVSGNTSSGEAADFRLQYATGRPLLLGPPVLLDGLLAPCEHACCAPAITGGDVEHVDYPVELRAPRPGGTPAHTPYRAEDRPLKLNLAADGGYAVELRPEKRNVIPMFQEA